MQNNRGGVTHKCKKEKPIFLDYYAVFLFSSNINVIVRRRQSNSEISEGRMRKKNHSFAVYFCIGGN